MRQQIVSRVLLLLLGCALIVLWLLHGAKLGRTNAPSEPTGSPAPVARADQDATQRALAIEAARDQIDATFFAPELQADTHEEIFVQLWDELRAAPDPAEVLAAFAFGELVVKQPIETSTAEQGIRVIGLGQPERSLNPEKWRAWVQQLKRDGYYLVQSEWRHARFDPEPRDSPRSAVAMTLHVANAERRERWIVRGILEVQWQTARGERPFPARIDATALEVLTRTGELPFERVLTNEVRTELNPVLIDPLIVHDLNGDGYPEIILAAQNLLHWNFGGGRFQTSRLCHQPVPGLNSALIADITGDGLVDLLGADREGLVLFHGDGQGSFTSGPRRIRFTQVELPNPFAMTAGDVDGDGDLDVWLAQYKQPYLAGQMPTPYHQANDGFPSFLLLNNGQGDFHDATAERGLAEKRFRRTYSASFIDLDNDVDLDLLVVSDFAGVDLYYNNGRGHFADMTGAVLDETHGFGMAHSFGDFNSDGLLDFLMIGMNSYAADRLDHLGLGSADLPEYQIMRPKMASGNRLFLQGNNRWQSGLLSESIARSGWSWGVASFDSDNDSDLDVYIVNGHKSRQTVQDYESHFWRHDIYVANSNHDPALDIYFRSVANRLYGRGWSYGGYEKNRFYLNENGQAFLEIGFLAGLSMEEDCRNAVADDLDGDGKLDLLVTTLEEWPQARQALHIFRNRTEATGNWIGIKLRGAPGCSPIGAKVTLTNSTGRQIRWLVTGDSYRSQHSDSAHFGLGAATQVEKIEIHWPTGHIERLDNPAINQFHSITRGLPVKE